MTRGRLIWAIVGLVAILAVAAILVPSPRLQGVIVGGLIGVVASVVTLFGQYYLRRSDPLIWDIKAWSASQDGALNTWRDFVVRILNTREIGTALWNVRVVFYKDSEQPFGVTPRLSVGEVSEQRLIEVIDLPPQETVTRHLRVSFPSNEVASIDKVKNADRVKLVADIPGEGKNVFEEDLSLWSDQSNA